MVLKLEKYSEKSLAIFGDTTPHKDQLLALGGKFISNLKGRPGWIFFLNMREKLEEFVAEINSCVNSSLPVPVSTPDSIDDLVYIPSTDTSKELTNTLHGIQFMIRQLQHQFNVVMDLVEKSRVDQPKVQPKVQPKDQPQDDFSEDIGEKPKSLLRR